MDWCGLSSPRKDIFVDNSKNKLYKTLAVCIENILHIRSNVA